MQKIDEAILCTNKVICKNIKLFGRSDRGFLSQNILAQLRNFVEYVAIKAYIKDRDINPHDYKTNDAACKNMQRRGELRFLYEFHEMLQKSVSHYTVDEDGSERLMLKYYEYLLKIKLYLMRTFNLNVLENIDDFPLNTDTEILEYYEKIVKRIETPSSFSRPIEYNDRYYVQKIKPFFVRQKIYYEITFTAVNSKVSKFDRVIAFTRCEITDNYAVKFSIHNDTVNILAKDTPILIIDDYEVSIRPCEWDNLSKILGTCMEHGISSNEYKELMRYLTTSKMSLTELVNVDQDYYNKIKNQVTARTKTVKIYKLLDQCRKIITENKPGTNILRYLLHKMNNRVIKSQYSQKRCDKLSNLYLKYSCIPFDKMPYCTSLYQHNPRIYDLLDAIPVTGREHELFARFIKNNTEINGHLFTSKENIKDFEGVDKLIQRHNNTLYYKHDGRRIEQYKNYIYIRGYVENNTKIIEKLQELASSGISHYTASVDSWISREAYIIDDDSKKETIRQMFADSHVAFIYGSAGTGKSTLIKHISNFWADKRKIFLANTHPAVDNMRRKVTAGNSEYYTIAKFLLSDRCNSDCDVLFIDECSTVSNEDMRKVLDKANFKLLVLVGDIYQIESIYFGNWFNIAKMFVPITAIFELTKPYRTQNQNLITVWDRVRNLNDSILESLVKNGNVARFDESIFNHFKNEEDEIILCLNYDGLYGVNNINRFLQNSNPNIPVEWGISTYKVGDPILFNESNVFSPLIHNNSKGKIISIQSELKRICFNIELNKSINELDAEGYNFKLIGESSAGNSIISFCVNRHRSTDEDDDDSDSTVVPFQVAYAISIHKAQGLEYNSVKIVITNEIEERITLNIFYTAITRTKNKLKIYWSPETEQHVLRRLEVKNSKKDAYLLAQLSSLKLSEHFCNGKSSVR